MNAFESGLFDNRDAEPSTVGCPECGCTNPGCKNGCKLTKLDEIHAWLTEIMPAARTAVKLLNARESLARRWRGGKDAK